MSENNFKSFDELKKRIIDFVESEDRESDKNFKDLEERMVNVMSDINKIRETFAEKNEEFEKFKKKSDTNEKDDDI